MSDKQAADTKCPGCGRFLAVDWQCDDYWVFWCGDCGREFDVNKNRHKNTAALEGRGGGE